MAHKEDKIIGLLVIDLDRRANLAILGACWASDKRQDCDWDLRRRKHREKREREMMYKKTQLYLLTKLSQFTKQKNRHHWRIWSLRWKKWGSPDYTHAVEGNLPDFVNSVYIWKNALCHQASIYTLGTTRASTAVQISLSSLWVVSWAFSQA